MFHFSSWQEAPKSRFFSECCLKVAYFWFQLISNKLKIENKKDWSISYILIYTNHLCSTYEKGKET
jgi:hypothetical protein